MAGVVVDGFPAVRMVPMSTDPLAGAITITPMSLDQTHTALMEVARDRARAAFPI